MAQIAVLEDSRGRVETIQRIVDDDHDLTLFTTSMAFNAWLPTASDVVLIALDHHLGPPSAGNGLHAAYALAQLPPLCPVILHSSDTTSARAMQQLLDDAGWQTTRFIFNEPAWSAAYEALVRS